MCGTSNASRTIPTPACGTGSVRFGGGPFTNSASDLKYLSRSGAVTLSNSGVSPSYILAWRSAPGGGGTEPYWPDGITLRAKPA
jgi:hypothetical protein